MGAAALTIAFSFFGSRGQKATTRVIAAYPELGCRADPGRSLHRTDTSVRAPSYLSGLAKNRSKGDLPEPAKVP